MSDPSDIPGRHVPPRADPIQPDQPGSGQARQDPDAPAARDTSGTDRRGADEDRDAGLKNIREGYGGASTRDGDDDPSMVPNRPATDAQ